MLDNVLSFFLTPLLNKMGAEFFILFIAFFSTLLFTLLYKAMSPQHRVKQLKKELDLLRKELLKNKDNKELSVIINKQIMRNQIEVNSYNLYPTLITLIPNILLLSWIGKQVSGLFISILWIPTPWFIVFILFSICSSILVRDFFQVY